jgi:RNA polymerase sigma-B factor
MPHTTPIVSEEWLLERYRQHGDKAAREELVQRMTPLVRRVAETYRSRAHQEDLVQIAWLGLVKAIDRYDPQQGTSLRTYAIPTMYGELRRYLRDHSWAMRVPRPLQERVLHVTKATERLTASTGRSPTPQQLADELDLELEDVLEALQASSAHTLTSLDAPAGRTDDGRERDVADTVGYDDERLDIAEHMAGLHPLLHTLDRRARKVLHLRFVDDLTQTEIAQQVGCSQMQVSRILRASLARLHEQATKQPDARLDRAA